MYSMKIINDLSLFRFYVYIDAYKRLLLLAACLGRNDLFSLNGIQQTLPTVLYK